VAGGFTPSNCVPDDQQQRLLLATPLAVRTDDGGHRLEEARPRCPLPAVVPSVPMEHPCLRKDAFSTVRNNRSSFAESCVDVFLPARSHGPSTLAESSPPVFPQRHWIKSSTTPHGNDEARRFRITHPFHPLVGREFELVEYRHNWGEHRVFFYDAKGQMASIPASWTSVVGEDPFVVVAAGRAYFRPKDLLGLGDLLRALQSVREG